MDSEVEKNDYELFLLLSTLGANKIRAVLILAHLYPKAITATQLSTLLGYSMKARTIYRGILDDLQERELIFLDKLTPKVASIRLNHENDLLKRLIELAKSHGADYLKVIDDLMGKKNEDENY
ncbi:MAG: hypothetical protein KAU62_11200 [Candidatus Heimdallarchaeota archaeon]|nr:hypothetical protein [Candidatus Heimdallarchaeota archaeon]MCG3256648.1 hypothetical protein [Candidatus Heimdallarchaeota archaeon]MCK4611713.1 hypothetical protein [Candidatus Heimdallarchaeota archaeon]